METASGSVSSFARARAATHELPYSIAHDSDQNNNNSSSSGTSEYAPDYKLGVGSDFRGSGIASFRQSGHSDCVDIRPGASLDYRADYRASSAGLDYRAGSVFRNLSDYKGASDEYKTGSEYDRSAGSASHGPGSGPGGGRSSSSDYAGSPPGRSQNVYQAAFWNYVGVAGRRSSNFPYNDSAGLYAQTNVGSYMEGPHGAHHPSAGGQMYPSYPSQATHPGVVGVGISPQAIGVAQQAQYLQSGQASSQRVPISHTTRASPITVQWLLENYETADGVSLPRSTLYNHYLRHCADSKIDAVNAASFGKLIRSVFLGLKTRRLGTRGNSKYHYYGVRVKPNSPLARLTDDSQVALRAQPSSTKRSASGGSNSGSRPSSGHSEPASAADGHESAQHTSHRQYLGNAPGGLSDLPVLDLTDGLPDGISKQELARFGTLYRHHCEALLEVVSNLQFDLVESLWQTFWKSPAAVNKGESGTFESSDVPFETARLVAVCRCKPVQKFVKETDYILYQKIVDILVPNVLRAIPSTLTQGIRNFAKGLENILIGSMSEMPKEIVNVKVAAVSAFSQTLRRYTSLNHLAQAARAVLQNPQQINQMWTDLNKVDFTNVQEQSSWVCQCDEALIQKLEQDFKHTLGQQQSLEQWAQWLENVVSLVLGEHEGQESYPRAARQFLLNWSFYSSMIIRDLTLRSAASFGSFHLIRLLYDEYMFYLIEHKVAAFSGQSPLAVMGECVGLSTFSGGDSLNGSMNGDDDDNDDDSPDDDDDEGPLLTAPPLTQTIMMAVGQQDSMIGSRNGDELMAVGGRIGADHVMAPGFGEPELKRMKTEYMP